MQKAVQEAANEARDYERKVSAEQEADLMKKLEEAGVKLSKPDLAPFVEATKDVHNEFDAEYGADLYKKNNGSNKAIRLPGAEALSPHPTSVRHA